MEKSMKDDDIRELEDEIDSAVDRLFTAKEGRTREKGLEEPPALMPSFEMEKGFDLEGSLDLTPPSSPIPPPDPAPAPPRAPAPSAPRTAAPLHTPPVPPAPPASHSSIPMQHVKSIENMEAQILSLEWEITEEKLEKAKGEVLVFREFIRENVHVVSVLDLMDKVLDEMMADTEAIHPSMIQFLLDSKETIKLLMKNDAEGEVRIYKDLACKGLEARFSCLQRPKKEVQIKPSSLSPKEEIRPVTIPRMEWEKFEEVLGRLNSFSDRMDGILDKIDRTLSGFAEKKGPSKEIPATGQLPLDITIFEASGEFFGVESDKVCKLFKVPSIFHDKYSNQENIRLRDFQVRMIDFKRASPEGAKDRKGEKRILVVRDDGEYKGLIVQRVIKRLSAPSEFGREYGEHFSGVIHWTYQQRQVEVPILDLRTF